jgi:RimJ/RimL family protein N-acetyltransferase
MTMHIRHVPLAEGRLRLVPLEISHTEALHAAGASAEVWRHLPHQADSFDDMKRMVRQAVAEQEKGWRYTYTIFERDTVIGSTSILSPSPQHRSFEIGFTWLTPSSWGSGLNQAAKYALLKHGFEDADAVRIQFRTSAANIRSQQALKKIGAVYEGTLRKSFDGTDMMFFSILNDEWPAVKEKLMPYTYGGADQTKGDS